MTCKTTGLEPPTPDGSQRRGHDTNSNTARTRRRIPNPAGGRQPRDEQDIQGDRPRPGPTRPRLSRPRSYSAGLCPRRAPRRHGTCRRVKTGNVVASRQDIEGRHKGTINTEKTTRSYCCAIYKLNGWCHDTPHQKRHAVCSLVIASPQLLDGLDRVKAGLALGALVCDLAPLQDTLRGAENAQEVCTTTRNRANTTCTKN